MTGSGLPDSYTSMFNENAKFHEDWEVSWGTVYSMINLVKVWYKSTFSNNLWICDKQLSSEPLCRFFSHVSSLDSWYLNLTGIKLDCCVSCINKVFALQAWGLKFHSLEPTEKCLAWEQILVIPGLVWKYADPWGSLMSHISLLSDL